LDKSVVKRKYPSDLTDSQWNHIKDLFPKPKATGRPREVDFREIVNAILYLVFTGCQWRFLPTDSIRNGAPVTVIFKPGKTTERGIGCTKLCALN